VSNSALLPNRPAVSETSKKEMRLMFIATLLKIAFFWDMVVAVTFKETSVSNV
jgi:hypothetical protein